MATINGSGEGSTPREAMLAARCDRQHKMLERLEGLPAHLAEIEARATADRAEWSRAQLDRLRKVERNGDRLLVFVAAIGWLILAIEIGRRVWPC